MVKPNTINLDVTHDAIFKRATVKADDTLNATIGNNLNVESARDSYSSNSNGFNMSAGVSSSGGDRDAQRYAQYLYLAQRKKYITSIRT